VGDSTQPSVSKHKGTGNTQQAVQDGSEVEASISLMFILQQLQCTSVKIITIRISDGKLCAPRLFFIGDQSTISVDKVIQRVR
jgi:hypothetical protein